MWSSRSKTIVWSVGLILLAPAVTHAEISKKDRKEIQQLGGQTLYSRIDIPHTSGRHAWGTYKAPLVEVTPEGHNTDGELGMSSSGWHAQSTFWGTPPNAKLQVDEISFDEDEVEIELEGVGDYDDSDTVIKFKNIQSRADFDKAFDHAFSRTPLQDGHDDWSAEIKQAVGERKLLNGMNKRQVFYVTGAPERVEKTDLDGKNVEIWYLRQNKGVKMGFWWSSSETGGEGMPSQLRFEDGSLVGKEKTSTPNLDLDE